MHKYCMYMFYFHQADSKLREEEKRALRYLETRRDCNSVQAVSISSIVLVWNFVNMNINFCGL